MSRGVQISALLIACALAFPASGISCDTAPSSASQELLAAPIEEIRAALEQKRTSSLALAQASLLRIAGCTQLHAIISLNPNAFADARRLDAERAAGNVRGPLHGIPVIVKDNIDVAGLVTTAGSLALVNNLRTKNAPLVDRLIAAGAVVIAKSNLSEWANFRSRGSSSGWSAVGGLAVNARDPQRTACGSSSGSAVAVAAHLAPLAIGTETNGSLVCPASVNGVVALKPTVGLISGEGIVPISRTQDTAGPMAASVADVASLLTALVESPDRAQRINYRAGLRGDALVGARIGVLRLKGFSPATESVFAASLELLKKQGAVLVEIASTDLNELRDLELPLLLTEFKAGIDGYLATTPSTVKSRTLGDLIAFNAAEPRELPWFGQDLFIDAQAAAALDDAKYLQMRDRALNLAREKGIDRLLRENQLVALIAPTSGPAWSIDLINGDRSVGSASLLPAVAGYPHLTLPMGEVAGLPVGLSFMGGKLSEQTLLALGYSFEKAKSGPARPR